MPKNGTDIQTRATANAVQHLALLGIGQQLAAPVVDQHYMEFVRPVGFARTPRTADQRAISSNALPRPGSREYRPKYSQIFEPWNDFLNPRDHDVNARNARAEATVAFIGGNRNDAGVR